MSGEDALQYIGGPYLIGFLATVLIGALMAHPHSSARDRRTGARLMLLSPVWPAPAVLALARAIVRTWKLADWKRP
ncbi:hypothetical protein PP641_gp042 [Arthrobacter phage SilentRX]|uniref:Uncharacterized protein n=1 Tax=Arthrobacter phage SilentRX TaxID=2836091 RepID=A0A8F3E7W7_9CAUD|nr:hypothetical protein PP641_gp042 [Arthrobacter phage SilentRX]QWY82782.1 hypothetical protein SEA_SILENTRX_42 [Arthrobacter phage SilentRX]